MCNCMFVNGIWRDISAKFIYSKRRTDKIYGKWKYCRRNWPKQLQSDASKLPSKSNSNVTRFTTDNYDNNNGAFDTNNWGTSAMWNFNGNNKYSGSMYTYPLAFKAAKDGMWISKPSTRIGSTYCVMTLTTNGDYTDFSVRPDFSTENAKVR